MHPGTGPVFVQGTSNKPPWGFTFPALAGTPLCPAAPCLDAAGGIVGAGLSIGGIDHSVANSLYFRYDPSTQADQPPGCQRTLQRITYFEFGGEWQPGRVVSNGVDINAVPGDLIGKPVNAAPTRVNPSFGAIAYTQNDRVGNYNGVTFDLRSRVGRGFFDASYMHSSSKDDASRFPTATNPHQY